MSVSLLAFVSPLPLKRDLTHCFGFTVFYPCHKVPVKLEVRPTCFTQETPYVLSVSVGACDRCFLRYLPAVPVEVCHLFSFFDSSHLWSDIPM